MRVFLSHLFKNPLISKVRGQSASGIYMSDIATAGSGREAMQKAEASLPDVVLMDTQMKPLSGYDAARLMKAEYPGVKIIMLMKAYGLSPDTDSKDNFADAGSTWYTGYLAAAKRLALTGGVGNNLFAPEQDITRQEMFTLLYNALKKCGSLPSGTGGKALSDFSDSGEIAS